jgi:hypothetical protein
VELLLISESETEENIQTDKVKTNFALFSLLIPQALLKRYP